MKQWALRTVLMGVLACVHAAHALVLPDLYEAAVPVGDLSTQQRNLAVKTAMSTVLTKVSGNREVTTVPVINKQLSNASRYMMSYEYQREGDGLNLNVKFDPSRIKKLLSTAGQTLWQADRPALLVWLSYQSLKPASQSFITAESDHTLLTLWQKAAHARGMPVFFPIADMTTLQHMHLSDILNFNAEAAEKAGARYDLDAYTMVNISQKRDKTWRAKFMLVFEGMQYRWELEDPELAQLVDHVNDILLDSFATRFAVSANHANTSQIQFLVTDIESMEAFHDTLKYFDKLALLDNVQALKVQPHQVIFQADLVGSQTQFDRVLKEDRLVAKEEKSQNKYLTYRLLK